MATAQTNAKLGDYVTYAPKGETCNKCGKPFNGFERVWRLRVEQPSGARFGPYQHYDKC
ncbi:MULTISPECIES: hypothetical protein [unclassified Streptomyces]|uniref:hypothetical protein n=1 Tax=unclassified Streptomyces TaxID=2593676 RepID=UPI00278BC42A|nr:MULTISPECIES: hypothetical protein [unclassified Streptomyces]